MARRVSNILNTFRRVVAIEVDPRSREAKLHNEILVMTYKKLVTGEPVEEIPGRGTILVNVGPPQLVILDVSELGPFFRSTLN